MQADVERFLAQLLVNGDLRERFLADPKGTALQHGLSADESRAMEGISKPSLQTAAQGYEQKRNLKQQLDRRAGFQGRLRRRIGAALSFRGPRSTKPKY